MAAKGIPFFPLSASICPRPRSYFLDYTESTLDAAADGLSLLGRRFERRMNSSAVAIVASLRWIVAGYAIGYECTGTQLSPFYRATAASFAIQL